VFKVHFGGGKGSTWLTPDGDTWGTIEAEQWGLGIGVARFNIGPLQVAQSIAVTPIDHIRSTAWSTIAATRDPKCSDPAQGPAGVMMTEQVRQVRRDFFIWENQRYVTKPLYVLPEEHNFFELRKWFRQFYTEAAVDQTDDAAAVHLAMP
jgi:hypothetical protein